MTKEEREIHDEMMDAGFFDPPTDEEMEAMAEAMGSAAVGDDLADDEFNANYIHRPVRRKED